jgi:transcriptional regulator with XRE-family HTH domain
MKLIIIIKGGMLMLALKYCKVGAGMNSISSFRSRFLYLKDEKKVSLEDIAKAIKTNKASLSKVVNGKLNLKKDMIEALANYFDVDQAYLLGESDIRRQDNKIHAVYLEVIEGFDPAEINPKEFKELLEVYKKMKNQNKQ